MQINTAPPKAKAPSQLTDFGLKLLSPLWVSVRSFKFNSPATKAARNSTETKAIATNAMTLMLIPH